MKKIALFSALCSASVFVNASLEQSAPVGFAAKWKEWTETHHRGPREFTRFLMQSGYKETDKPNVWQKGVAFSDVLLARIASKHAIPEPVAQFFKNQNRNLLKLTRPAFPLRSCNELSMLVDEQKAAFDAMNLARLSENNFVSILSDQDNLSKKFIFYVPSVINGLCSRLRFDYPEANKSMVERHVFADSNQKVLPAPSLTSEYQPTYQSIARFVNNDALANLIESGFVRTLASKKAWLVPLVEQNQQLSDEVSDATHVVVEEFIPDLEPVFKQEDQRTVLEYDLSQEQIGDLILGLIVARKWQVKPDDIRISKQDEKLYILDLEAPQDARPLQALGFQGNTDIVGKTPEYQNYLQVITVSGLLQFLSMLTAKREKFEIAVAFIKKHIKFDDSIAKERLKTGIENYVQKLN